MTSAPRTCALAALAALPLAALAVLAPTPASAAPAPSGFTRVGAGQQMSFLATGSGGGASTIADELRPSSTGGTSSVRITVTYHGFPTAAKAAFARAVNTWQQTLTSSVPISIDATWKPLGPGVLGSAGSNNLYQQDSTKTYVVEALANKINGGQIDPGPDIIANFSSSFSNWHFGTSPAPVGTYDFQSVVTHEIGHGLGILGGGNVSNGQGNVTYNGGYALGYAKYAETATGKRLVSFTPQPSSAVAAALTSGKLFFDSPAVRNVNGGKTAKLYAPSTWQPGSSFSHLDEATYRKGNANSLMTPQLADGETVRTPGPIVKAILKTIGW